MVVAEAVAEEGEVASRTTKQIIYPTMSFLRPRSLTSFNLLLTLFHSEDLSVSA